MENKYKIFLCLVAGIICGASAVYFPNRKSIEFGKDLSLYYECKDFLEGVNAKKNDNPDENYEFTNALLKAEYDQFTVYSKKERDTEEFYVDKVNETPASLTTGYEIAFNDNREIYFSKIEEGSSAEKQGLKKGDIVVSIDGKTIDSVGMELAEELCGEEAILELVINRNGEEIKMDFLRESDRTKTYETVESCDLDDILYLVIKKFRPSSFEELESALNDKSFESIIIDLRDNPGGDVSECVDIANKFVGDGCAVLHFETGIENEFYTNSNEKDINCKMIVLVNDRTASSGEILTAFLKQYRENTTLVGTKTYGKGIFQTKAIVHNGILKYTAGYFTVGDWECWQGVGIEPDIEIEMDSSLIGTDEDIQLQKAIELLS